MYRLSVWILLVALLVSPGPVAWAGDASWEYRVVVLQGLATGGTFEKQASGVYIDTRKTNALNEMAADGWELVSAVGAPGADHTIYLRRRSN